MPGMRKQEREHGENEMSGIGLAMIDACLPQASRSER